jgi:nitrite reductase/ring-hydroxylating ferredoxin subunit/uncharacterized membrane protein
MRLRYQVDRLERSPRLDGTAARISKVWDTLLPRGGARDALHGTWLGHPLHPALTDLPIGFWTSACVLDAVRGEATRTAAQHLVGLGVLSALPTIASGAADYVALGDAERPKRVGAVHAVANATATALYLASWLARRDGRHRRGVALGMAGAVAATVGGTLGGHLAYRNAVGVDRTAGEQGVTEWTEVGALRDLPMRQAVRRRVGDVDVLLYRSGSTVRALSATCSHLGGPLDEGTVDDDCVTCPWHGSTFDLVDGGVVRGPATAPQPAYEVRVVGRTVQVRLEQSPGRERVDPEVRAASPIG